ncbi:uncharacterized protein [Blastocystis hominis]|uniref:subtilisin n=1 Tax=Blastocystis hominis TaxID=12968 RepID=D8M014_BLAHO|nr:uncharacterized protein [Blastocystis hominis]CBK21403.2 unnamed protein product [Blastocystis hominis]|eukprot:XP_012895451.1 uncharacterized protein [Blastocystis hominis]
MVKSSLARPLLPLANLLSQKDILSVSLKPKWKLHHLRQLNDYAQQSLADGYYDASGESSKIYKLHNLNGRNVLVGVGDSGIDWKSTYFYDPDHSVKRAESGSSDHRKISLYVPLFGKDETSTDGHGTHVCGTIAGKAYDSSNSSDALYNGIAEEAKLLFVDLEDNDGYLYLPKNIYDDYYMKYLYNNDVRISSNSWGSRDEFFYDSFCVQTDEFVWDHDDMLILFAAGNEGEGGLFGSVTSPALSKNVITVGATHSERNHDGKNYITYFSSRGRPTRHTIKPDIVAPGEQFSAKSLSKEDCGLNCDNHGGVVEMPGTSMATPAVAGIVALITQYLKEKSYHNRENGVFK